MKKTTLLLLLLTCFLLASECFAKVGGAIVQAVTLEHNSATITVLNQSNQDITGFSLAITQTFTDGRVAHSERTEDYGPLRDTVKALQPHQVAEEHIAFGPEAPVKVEAKVIVAIYQDQTAEVEDGSEKTLEHTVGVRTAIYKALQQSADIIAASATGKNPSAHARASLEQLAQTVRDKQKGRDEDVNESYIQSAIEIMKAAPTDGTEPEFVQEQAARLHSEALAFSTYSQVRRAQ